MTANEVRELCKKAIKGEYTLDSFYHKIAAAADDMSTDDDLACTLEDVCMDIEMAGNGGKRLLKEAAEQILKELDR